MSIDVSAEARCLSATFADFAHAWARQAKTKRHMHAVTLGADARTEAERDQMMAEAARFAAYWDCGVEEEGAWLVLGLGGNGMYHVHGIVITDESAKDVEGLWVRTVTGAQRSAGAQHVQPVRGSTLPWSASSGLRREMGRWVYYAFKEEERPPSLRDEQRVVAATGCLCLPWCSARVRLHRDPNDRRLPRCEECRIELKSRRQGRRYCSARCRARNARERIARSPGDEAFREVIWIFKGAERPVTTREVEERCKGIVTRDRVRAAVAYLAKHKSIVRLRGGWIPIPQPAISLVRQGPLDHARIP